MFGSIVYIQFYKRLDQWTKTQSPLVMIYAPNSTAARALREKDRALTLSEMDCEV